MTIISIFGADGRMAQAIVAAIADRDDSRIGEHRPDVYVDFTVPEAVEEHLDCAVRHGKPILIGTTGLTADHQRLIDEAARKVAVIQAANTSLGVNLLSHLVREAARKLGEDWDVEIVEM
ncbi:MAG: 4-hydroxy-tetrahydrodipicolinate reductase, partial [Allosphingosinicella sp.]